MSRKRTPPDGSINGSAASPEADFTTEPPFETKELRRLLADFLNQRVIDLETKLTVKIGDYKWGVYAFYDYDGEPIYVGQTNERLRTRIRRHLTNQRTDAVAMNVLDPFEVYEVAVWPLPQYQNVGPGDRRAKATLDALEFAVFNEALKKSRFGAVLNEKDPPTPGTPVVAGEPTARGRIVSDEVKALRSHPDTRIARRSATLARLAQVISERQVKPGLRRALLTQAKRLQWLADRRLTSLSETGALAEEDTDQD
ncbi:MAG TPA: GIY-YIG nuclease family protein [Pyrinomonadaceae bacterium]|jgi:hypothetical protein|nr:GIY-YIG nuclease family protein [Pyrinomonadaceae bacterium]